MLVPVVLPFQLTIVVLAIGTVLVLLWLRPNASERVVAGVIVSWVVLFIPVILAVGWVVDAFRYGEFHYQTATQIEDPYIRIPPSATDIVVFKYASGHESRFRVKEEDLQTWIEQFPVEPDRGAPTEPSLLKFDFDFRFQKRGWKCPEDIQYLPGPRARDGAGFSIWFSPETQTAYQSAGYW